MASHEQRPHIARTAPNWACLQVFCAVLLMTGYAGSAQAADMEAAPQTAIVPLGPAAPLDTVPLVHLDWHGELRARTETLGGIRVNRDDAALPAHLDVRHGIADQASAPTSGRLSAADLRIRLAPVLHVGDWSQVHTQLEAWGSAGGDPNMASLQERFALRDWSSGTVQAGTSVRRLWLQARAFGLLQFDVGRMPDEFGMGILRNAGDDLLQDVQSSVDRVRLAVELFGLKASIARTSLASWPQAYADGALYNYNGTQRAGNATPLLTLGGGSNALPLQDSADVVRYDLEIHGGKIKDRRGLAWSGAVLWQTQDQAFRLESIRDPSPGAATPQQQMANAACGDDCILLVQRLFKTYTFQGAVDWHTTLAGSPLRVQAEAVGVYGTIARTDVTASVDPKTIVAGAGVARTTWERGLHDLQLDLGATSGPGDGGFGVNDTTNFKYGGTSDGAPRSLLTGMHLHRSFRIDGLLFRDIIGAVANAAYLKPTLRWHALGRGGRDLAVEASVLAAIAVSPDATPGRHRFLGWEPELTVHYRLAQSLEALGRGSLLLAGEGLANRAGVAADLAWRGEAVLRLRF